MVRLAIAKNPGFTLSTVEMTRPGKSYSIDTLRYFSARQGPKDSLYFILGMDAFRDIDSWKNFREIFPLCYLIVTSRPGFEEPGPHNVPVAVRELFCYDKKNKFYQHTSGTHLFFLKITQIGISASNIRDRLRQGKSIRYLVPLEVEGYIKKQGLYRERREGR